MITPILAYRYIENNLFQENTRLPDPFSPYHVADPTDNPPISRDQLHFVPERFATGTLVDKRSLPGWCDRYMNKCYMVLKHRGVTNKGNHAKNIIWKGCITVTNSIDLSHLDTQQYET